MNAPALQSGKLVSEQETVQKLEFIPSTVLLQHLGHHGTIQCCRNDSTSILVFRKCKHTLQHTTKDYIGLLNLWVRYYWKHTDLCFDASVVCLSDIIAMIHMTQECNMWCKNTNIYFINMNHLFPSQSADALQLYHTHTWAHYGSQ